MGVRGTVPKPTALKILNGNPGKRPLPANEPKPEICAPEMPEWLDEFARKEWVRVVPLLLKINLLAQLDCGALAVYCSLVSAFRSARLEGDNARMVKLSQAIQRYCVEFGMTPSSRGRMQVPSGQGEGDSGGERDLD